MNKPILLATSLLCFAAISVGCGKDESCDSAACLPTCDTAHCDDYSDPYVLRDTQIDTVGFGCDENAYWFDIYTAGLSTGGWLYMYQTGSSSPWNEDHPVNVYDADADGNWTRLYLSLDSVYPDAAQVVSGSTTLYDCTEETGMLNTLTFVIEVDNHNGTLAIDCAVWGHNPDAAPADDCERLEPDDSPQLR